MPLAVLTVIFALPGLMALTTPFLDTVATFLLLLVQVRAVLALVGVSVAFSVSFLPTFKVAFFLLRVTFVGAAGTVILQVAFLPLAVVTVMMAVPFFSALTTPFLLTLATLLLLLVQVRVVLALEGFTVAFRVRDRPA